MQAQVVERIITSRYLILQSKRALLSSAERRATRRGSARLRARVEQLRAEAERADEAYRATMLRIGGPEHPDYWPVAYARLIAVGNELTEELRHAMAHSPGAERHVSMDLQALERLVQRWGDCVRSRIAAA